MAYKELDLSGRSAVVIGGTSGIGHAVALGLAEAGADVAPTSRRSELVSQTASEIEALGRRSLRSTSDVHDRGSLEQLLASAIQAFGKVDILVNCAGRTKRAPTLDFSEHDWNAILETNLTGTLRAAQVFGRHMLQRGYGRMVHIASIASFVALYEVAAYAASKAAVASLTKSLALEWGPRGVCVNAIASGRVSHRLEPRIVGRHSPRSRVSHPHTDETVWRCQRTLRGSDLSCVRSGQLCEWGSACGRRRIPRERSESIAD